MHRAWYHTYAATSLGPRVHVPERVCSYSALDQSFMSNIGSIRESKKFGRYWIRTSGPHYVKVMRYQLRQPSSQVNILTRSQFRVNTWHSAEPQIAKYRGSRGCSATTFLH